MSRPELPPYARTRGHEHDPSDEAATVADAEPEADAIYCYCPSCGTSHPAERTADGYETDCDAAPA